VNEEEEKAVRKLANSHNASAKLVKRAQIITAMLDNKRLTATDAGIRADLSNSAGTMWVKRFNEEGLDGLEDRPRSGAPRKHDEKVRSKLISLALQKPPTLGLPYALWTLERLQTEFEEREGIHLSDSTIWEWMEGEGFKWRRQESWFREPEKHDPQFAEKRGPSSGTTATHPKRHG
jgi:transposase